MSLRRALPWAVALGCTPPTATDSTGSSGGETGDTGLAFAHEVGAAFCIARDRCGCPAEPDQPCQPWIIDQLTRFDADSLALGLERDDECAQQLVDQLTDDSCPTQAEVYDVWAACGSCPVFHGEAEAGAPCARLGLGGTVTQELNASDCAPGLTCFEGRCADPCATPGELGGPCNDEAVHPCGAEARCMDGSCGPPLEVGLDCERDDDCADPLFCLRDYDVCWAPKLEHECCSDANECAAGSCDTQCTPESAVCSWVYGASCGGGYGDGDGDGDGYADPCAECIARRCGAEVGSCLGEPACACTVDCLGPGAPPDDCAPGCTAESVSEWAALRTCFEDLCTIECDVLWGASP